MTDSIFTLSAIAAVIGAGFFLHGEYRYLYKDNSPKIELIIGVILFAVGISAFWFTSLYSDVENTKEEIMALEEENAELEKEINAIVKATLELTDEEYENYCESFENNIDRLVNETLSVQSNALVVDKLKEYKENVETIEELKKEL